jgi:hypothetical protein
MLSHYLETQEQLKGVLYNIIRSPQLKRGAKDEMKSFCKRVCEDIESRMDFYFIRYEVAVGWDKIEQFSERLLVELSDFKRWVEGDPGCDAQYTNNCEGKYGGCSYLKYCDSCGQDTSGLYCREKQFSEL